MDVLVPWLSVDVIFSVLSAFDIRLWALVVAVGVGAPFVRSGALLVFQAPGFGLGVLVRRGARRVLRASVREVLVAVLEDGLDVHSFLRD